MGAQVHDLFNNIFLLYQFVPIKVPIITLKYEVHIEKDAKDFVSLLSMVIFYDKIRIHTNTD